MSKELIVSAAPHETRVAILEEGQLCEIYIEREKEFALVGSIYKGRVTRVLPGMQSAFVDIGLDGDAFLYVSDFLEHLEEYDQVVSTVESKVEKMEQQGGQVFAPSRDAESAPTAAGRGEEIPADSPSAPAETQAEPQHESSPAAPPPYSNHGGPQDRRDRDARGFGRDRGGRQGRWGRRGGRGRDRRPGRDLPPSKYASPRPYEPRPSDSSFESSAPAGEPILLPGESLAKYKERVPLTPAAAASPAGAAAILNPESASAGSVPGTERAADDRVSSLPTSVFAPREESVAAEELAAKVSSAAGEDVRPGVPDETPEEAQELFEREQAEDGAEEHASGLRVDTDLSDDDVASLAAQLAEAKHEEAQAEADAEADSIAGAGLSDDEESPADEAQGAVEDDHEPRGEVNAAETTAEHPPAGLSGEMLPGEARTTPESSAEATLEPEPQPMAARIQDSHRARFQRPMRRGGRYPGGHRHRQQDFRHREPRRPQLISELLKAGQEIIVQIAKEPLGKKGARITSHVALPGRYLVYMPTVDHIGVSRKIASAENRSRLRRLVTEAKGTFPGGFIVRTAAAGANDDEIRTDVEFLGRTWGEIRGRSEQRKAPSLLHRDLNLVERILRDHVNSDYTAIWIDNEEEYGKVVDFFSRFQPSLVNRVKLYTKEMPIFEEFGIQQELDKALRPKVWLKSGGYIVINHTEALVAIDVNTGKYVGKGSTRLEDTIVKTNLEAVKEIVRQIRLRDLGGIIVVDFIDMEERRNREKVLSALQAALDADKAPSKALGFNEFGLVAITRKRTKQALERVLCQPCPYCTGSGMVKSVPTICYEIQAEARKMSSDLDAASITLRVHPEIAKALKTRESSLVEELEQATRKSVIIQSDATLHWEQYDIY